MLCFAKLHLSGRKSDRMPVAASCSGIPSIHRIRISLCPVVSHSIHTFQFPLVRRDKHLRGRIRVTKGAKLGLNRWCQLADFRERGGLRFVRARWHMNLIRRQRRQLFIMMRSSHHFHTHFARTPLRFNHKQLKPTPLIETHITYTDPEESSWTALKATSLSQRSTNFPRGL